MQLSLVALFAVLATGTCVPALLFLPQSICDNSFRHSSFLYHYSRIYIIYPVSEPSCLIAAAQDVVQLPESCDGCAAQFGIASAADSVINSVKSGLSSLGSDITGLF
ncbi:hypothetical protein K438DRAFT_1987143 [Mycena galopus ATCC 62051]|nr:hypothetical protein K438DRAFT_1987143 [Mycena galopus ATCC 62051]